MELFSLIQGREDLHPNEVVREVGGLSGRPLQEKSRALVEHVYRLTKGDIPIIGVGGIDSPESAYAMIRSGASLVQLFTGLVYQGPGVVRRINKGLVSYLERDGLRSISEAVGAKVRNLRLEEQLQGLAFSNFYFHSEGDYRECDLLVHLFEDTVYVVPEKGEIQFEPDGMSAHPVTSCRWRNGVAKVKTADDRGSKHTKYVVCAKKGKLAFPFPEDKFEKISLIGYERLARRK